MSKLLYNNTLLAILCICTFSAVAKPIATDTLKKDYKWSIAVNVAAPFMEPRNFMNRVLGLPHWYMVRRQLYKGLHARFQVNPYLHNTKGVAPFINHSRMSYSLGLEQRYQINKIAIYGAVQANLYHEHIRINLTDKDVFVNYNGVGIAVTNETNSNKGIKADWYTPSVTGILGMGYDLTPRIFLGLEGRGTWYNYFLKSYADQKYFSEAQYRPMEVYGLFIGYKF